MNRLHLHMRYQNDQGAIIGELYMMDDEIIWNNSGWRRNDARRHVNDPLERGENSMRKLTKS